MNDGNNNGQLRIANANSGGSRKAAWAQMWQSGPGIKLINQVWEKWQINNKF